MKDLTHVTLPLGLIDSVSGAETMDAVFQAAADWVPRVFDASTGSITLERDGGLEVRAFQGGCIFGDAVRMDDGVTKAEEVFRTRQPTILHDILKDDCPVHEMLAENGCRSMMLAPLISGKNCLGTLHVLHRDPNAFTHKDLTTLCAMARWIAGRIQIQQQIERLSLMARTDALTSAANRHEFLEQAQKMMARYERLAVPFSLLVVDIDHFKDINDGYGHAAGDAVICEIARRAAAQVRETDCFARIGGEEFAGLLDGTELGAAMMMAERLRMVIARSPVSFRGKDINVTVSIGVAEVLSDEGGIEQTMGRADAKLYKAKQAGRNRVLGAEVLEPCR